MGLTLTDDQLILKETARSFLDEKSPVGRMRELRDSEDATGFSRALWSEMAEMGWAGILFPEEFGGAGMGYGELGAVLEESGDREGLTLFVVNAGEEGLSVQRNHMLDGRNAAEIRLEGVRVEGDRILGQIDAGAELLDAVFDRAAIGLSAEMLGTFDEAFERTLAYLKEREQFDVKIGTFQALRHRAADMFCELELARSVVREALAALDAGREDVPQMASAAKARCSDVSSQITREAIQMHGGIGMTDEEEIGLFFKRAKAAELTLGDSIYHRDRYASPRGF